MSLMGGITDFLTGGEDSESQAALNAALAAYSGINTPTTSELTLPELQQYVQAGLMTPAQAAAVLQQSNAYDNVTGNSTANQASMDALSGLQEIADTKGLDPQAEAQMAQTESQLNQTLQGQRLSIMDQMAAKGIPTSLMGVSEQLASAGQDAEQAHQDAMQANSDAATRALQALEASGTMGQSIEQEQFSEQAQKAAAQNAIDQWNAMNSTNVNLANAASKQQANMYNEQNAQAVSNANTQNANARTQYNANLPQQVYEDQLQKAAGEAGVGEAQAKNDQAIGEQNAGTAGALLGTAATVGSGFASAPSVPNPALPAVPAAAEAAGPIALAAHGGEVLEMRSGGSVPGMARVPGDSPKNDTVPARLSPGEVVIPRTIAHSPDMAANFIRHLHRQMTPKSSVHPEDIKSVLHALTSIRDGGI